MFLTHHPDTELHVSYTSALHGLQVFILFFLYIGIILDYYNINPFKLNMIVEADILKYVYLLFITFLMFFWILVCISLTLTGWATPELKTLVYVFFSFFSFFFFFFNVSVC